MAEFSVDKEGGDVGTDWQLHLSMLFARIGTQLTFVGTKGHKGECTLVVKMWLQKVVANEREVF